MKTYHLTLCLLLLIFSCSQKTKESTEIVTDTLSAPATEQVSEPVVENNNLARLLMGKWQSTDDPKSLIEFKGSLMINFYGNEDSNSEPYRLAKSCLNASDMDMTEGTERKYLSVEKSDMCWFVVSVDQEYLELSYVGRGNSLKYQRLTTEPNEDPNLEYVEGILTDIYDTGIYGVFGLSLEVEGVKMDFNYEKQVLSNEPDLIGSYVKVSIKKIEERSEMDLFFKDTEGDYCCIDVSIYPEKSTEIDPSWEKIEGVLTALDVSGDTPDMYTVQTSDGQTKYIGAFVTEEHVALSGEEVVVYYRSTVRSIAMSLLKADPKEVNVEPQQEKDEPQEVKDQVSFIREKFSFINDKIKSGEYPTIAFDPEGSGEFVQYKRSMDGDSVRFMSVAYCHDHGCDKTSYYFWDNQLIFKFQEKSFWVGDTDEVSENRTYYLNEQEIRCLERSLKGNAGYDAAKKELSKVEHTWLDCGGVLDRKNIDELMVQTEETADAYFFQ